MPAKMMNRHDTNTQEQDEETKTKSYRETLAEQLAAEERAEREAARAGSSDHGRGAVQLLHPAVTPHSAYRKLPGFVLYNPCT